MIPANPSLRKPNFLAVIAVALGATFGLSAPRVWAGYIVTLAQVGPNVVATGAGPIDLTAMSLLGTGTQSTLVTPSTAAIYTGTSGASSDAYSAPTMTGPATIGPGPNEFFPTSGSGDIVGKVGPPFPFVSVPHGYISNAPLADTSTYNSATLTSLGITPGTYEWTWGAGANQNFTLVAAPEPSVSSLLMLGILFAGIRRRPLRPD